MGGRGVARGDSLVFIWAGSAIHLADTTVLHAQHQRRGVCANGGEGVSKVHKAVCASEGRDHIGAPIRCIWRGYRFPH